MANTEFQLRAELNRAEEKYLDAEDKFNAAGIEVKTAKFLAEGTWAMVGQVQRTKYKNPDQKDSDLEAVEALHYPQSRRHNRAMDDYLHAASLLTATRDKFRALEQKLHDFLHPEPRTPPRRPSPPRRATSPPPRRRSPSPMPCAPPHSPTSAEWARPKPFVNPRNPPTQSEKDRFFAAIDAAVANPSALKAFPTPPQQACPKGYGSRRECPKIALGLCSCALAELFEGKDLKVQRRKFHPDRFAACKEGVKVLAQNTASEVFKWVSEKHKGECERAEREKADERSRRGWGKSAHW